MALDKSRNYSHYSGSGGRNAGSRSSSRSGTVAKSKPKHAASSRGSGSGSRKDLHLLVDDTERKYAGRAGSSAGTKYSSTKTSSTAKSGTKSAGSRSAGTTRRPASTRKRKNSRYSEPDSHVARDVTAVISLGVIIFVALAMYLPALTDNPQPLGLAGAAFSDWLTLSFGFLAYFLPGLALLAWGAIFFHELSAWRGALAWGVIGTVFTFLYGGIFETAGEAGRITTEYMESLVGLFYPILLAILFIVSIAVLFRVTVLAPAARAASTGASAFGGAARWVLDSYRAAFAPLAYDLDEDDDLTDEEYEEENSRKRWEDDAVAVDDRKAEPTIGGMEDEEDDEEEEDFPEAGEPDDEYETGDGEDEDITFEPYSEDDEDDSLVSDEEIEFRVEHESGQVGFRFKSEQQPYELPPLTLLKDAPFTKNEKADLLKKASVIEKTLADFKIDAHVSHIQEGPRVTRYEIEIGPGINVSKIHNIADNLALELAVSAVRVEAPIPGKSAVGIEVPNQNAQLVTLKSILDSPETKNAKGICTVSLGRDIAGKPVVGNLAKMPHLLVAGATGSGKSVCLNTLIVSILFRAAPEELKLVLIDPKWVELSIYKELPHLITPVVHTKAEIIGTFGWLIKEMERRYQELQSAGAKNIASYNALVEQDDRLPYIIVVVDELADLFMMAGKIAEKQITRIAQKARAVGIHLVVATQRPDVKVITGTIKANIPSRIAFAVAQQVDSRTILDMNGAEKLLGEGDMLYNPIGAMKPFRVQGAFVSDEEVNQVVEFICAQRAPEFNEEITKMIKPDEEDDELAGGSGSGIEVEELDSLYHEAREIVLSDRKCSISWLQRRLRIGYQRSARIVDSLVREGIVEDDPETGSYKVTNL